MNERYLPPSIELRDVCVSYSGRWVVRNAYLQVRPGELMALVGPSGCGKSSLLATVNRLSELVPGCVVEGEVRIGDLDVLARDTALPLLRRRVGMVFQQPNPFPLSIAENLHFPLREHGVRDPAERERRIKAILRSVGLWTEVCARLHHPALTLSGGQQQRLCIARALVLEPEVLLLDEPCSALDPIAAASIESLILSLKHRYTMLMVTHNLAQARRLADAVTMCWVEDGCGCVVESGNAQSIFSAPAHAVTRDYCLGWRG